MEDSTAGVRLTTAKFYSPKGKPYSNVGVEPDIPPDVPVEPARVVAKPINGQLPAAADTMLNRAAQTARTLSQTLQASNAR